MARGNGRGFASMVTTSAGKRKQIQIASKGGKSAHEKGTAHTWTSAEARRAGQLGGRARQAKARASRKAKAL